MSVKVAQDGYLRAGSAEITIVPTAFTSHKNCFIRSERKDSESPIKTKPEIYDSVEFECDSSSSSPFCCFRVNLWRLLRQSALIMMSALNYSAFHQIPLDVVCAKLICMFRLRPRKNVFALVYVPSHPEQSNCYLRNKKSRVYLLPDWVVAERKAASDV